MSDLEWLQDWYSSKVDGEWEHNDGIQIDTLDNPGWSLKIALKGTSLSTSEAHEFSENKSEMDWIHWRVQNGRFEGYGGAGNLTSLIAIFRKWVTGSMASDSEGRND